MLRHYDVNDVKQLSKNRWLDILIQVGGIDQALLIDKEGPCPCCGGDTRFRFDDKDGFGGWFCSHCGGPSGDGGAGDGFALLQRVLSLPFANVVNAVGDFLRSPVNKTKGRANETKKENWVYAGPLSAVDVDKIESLDFVAWNPKKENDVNYRGSRLKPVMSSIYRDTNGIAIGAVVRLEIDGKKITPQIVRARRLDDGFESLAMLSMPEPRPLLGINHVKGEKPVIVVEGEKTQRAVSELLSDCEIVTWCGGSKAVSKSDWHDLNGLSVILWPDNDEPGFKAMAQIADILRKENCKVYTVNPPKGKEHGWDLADAISEGWTKQDILKHIDISINNSVIPVSNDLEQSDNRQNHYSLVPKLSEHQWHMIKPNGKPVGTIENFKIMLEEHCIYPKYNMISKEIEIPIPGVCTTIDNLHNVTLAHINSISNKNDFPLSNVCDYITVLADESAYNPIANFVVSKPWDGVDRITSLCSTIKAKDDEIKTTLLTKWLVGTMALQFCKSPTELHGVIIFKGKQGTGKTKWVRSLLPVELSQYYIATGLELDPSNKDSLTKCLSNFIVELGEFGGNMRKVDQDRLKAFLTNGSDTVRRPYDRRNSTYQRRTAFIASVNDERFLRDDTGNRRYWVIEQIGNIDFEHKIDMQQVFAQARHMYLSGFRFWLDKDEQEKLELNNENYRDICPITEMIDTRLNWDEPDVLWRETTASMLLIELGISNPSPLQCNKASAALTKHGCEFLKRRHGRFRLVPKMKKFSFDV